MTDSAAAHHSYALFNVDKTLTVSGIVKQWDWTNPHTWLVVVVRDGQAREVEWSVEGSSPAVWRRYGGSREMLKAGDQITVIFHPLRDGANGGQLQSVTMPDGRTIDVSKAAP
jgi:hypothetical protein